MPSIHALLQSAANQLKHLETASLDSEVLLSFVLQKPREYLLSHGEDEVMADKIERFNSLISRRAKHEPAAYLVKQKEFYGQPFFVDSRVHIPRPSTEDMIDCIKGIISKNFSGTLADIGTGSGCIAVTLALEFPNAKIIATDISNDALDVARQNARALGADRIKFLCGDLLAPLTEPVDVIVSNPPYGWPQVVCSFSEGRTQATRSPKGEVWSDDEEIKYQPKISYESGADGLDVINRLLDQLPKYLKDNGQAFIEFDPRQADRIKHFAKIKKDSSGFDRIARLTM